MTIEAAGSQLKLIEDPIKTESSAEKLLIFFQKRQEIESLKTERAEAKAHANSLKNAIEKLESEAVTLMDEIKRMQESTVVMNVTIQGGQDQTPVLETVSDEELAAFADPSLPGEKQEVETEKALSDEDLTSTPEKTDKIMSEVLPKAMMGDPKRWVIFEVGQVDEHAKIPFKSHPRIGEILTLPKNARFDDKVSFKVEDFGIQTGTPDLIYNVYVTFLSDEERIAIQKSHEAA